MELRRSILVVACGATLAALLPFAFAACAGSGDVASGNPADGGGSEVFELGETGALPTDDDADVPPGDVCGDRDGLQSASPWPLRGGCPTRAGWSSLAGPSTSLVGFATSGIRAAETSPALSADGVLWIGTSDGDILGVTLSGTPRWALRTGGAIKSSAAIDAEGNAVVGGTDGTLYAVHAGDFTVPDGGLDAGLYPPAKLVWSLPIAPMASSPVIGSDGTIYIGTLDGKLVAVAPRGASTKWSAVTNDTLGSSPAIGQDGTIYVGSSDHKLYAVHPDGTTAWSTDVGAEIHGSPAVGGDGTIYVGSADGNLHAVGASGAPKWSYATAGDITGTPAVYGGVVYVGSADKKLHAVSVTDGKERFTYLTLGNVGTPVIGSDGTVYVGADDARLYAISPKGTLVFSAIVRGRVKGAPAIGSGPALYVATDNGAALITP